MAAVTIAPDHVELDPGTPLGNTSRRVASEAIAPGDVVAVNPTTGQLVLAQAIASPAYVQTIAGIAMNGAQQGQPVTVAGHGTVTLSNSATMTAGAVYCLSPSTAGDIVPHSDLTAGQLVQLLGVAIDTTNILLAVNNTGVARG